MAEQSNRLRDFLITVAIDPEAARRFAADPMAEIGRAGLSAAESSLVLSRDSAKIREAIGGFDPSTQSGDRAGLIRPAGTAAKKGKGKKTKKKAAKKSKKGGKKK